MSSSDGLSGVDLLVEEFMDRRQRGEKPTIDEYCQRHPELADEIRDVFEALVMVGDLKPGSRDESLSFDRKTCVEGQPLDQVGDYRILCEIGRGGMGVVYQAEQLSLGRRVALKVLPRQLAGDGKSLARFRREAKAAARMHHTNIVPVFEVGDDDEHVFYAMQLIQGQSLDLVINDLHTLREESTASRSSSSAGSSGWKKNQPARGIAQSLVSGRFQHEQLVEKREPEPSLSFPSDQAAVANETVAFQGGSTTSAALPGKSEFSTAENDPRSYFTSVAQIGQQTASALSYSHARGIVHRDIKPSNLLLDAAGVVWVTDFGLAKTGEHGLTHTGDILGTIRYMSPERFRGQCDVRADVYSLGLTLYELATLKPAFAAKDQMGLIELIHSTDPPLPRTIDLRVPRDLETIILKAIDKDPKRRYQSADEMEEDLQRFIDDEPVRARRISTFERFARWSRRNKTLATLLSLLVTLLLVVAIGSSIAAGYFQNLSQDLTKAKVHAEKSAANAESAATRANEQKDVAEKNLVKAKRAEREARQQQARAELEKMRADELLTRAEWLVYASKLTLAQNDFEAGSGGLALRYLDQCQVIRRGWEHHYLWTRINARQTLVGHRGDVRSVAFSPDGKRIVTAGFDRTPRVWNAETGQELLSLNGHTTPVHSVTFSPDGKRIVTSGGQPGAGKKPNETKVWDAQTGKTLLNLTGHSYFVWAVTFSPDGKRILTGAADWAYGSGEAKLWDAETGQELFDLKGHKNGVHGVAFSPNGKRVVTGSHDGMAKVWDAATGQHLLTLKGRTSSLSSVAFSPDGKRIITGGGRAGLPLGVVRFWDAETGNEVFVLKAHEGHVSSVAFSPNGKRVVTGSWDQTAKVWDAKTGKNLLVLKGHAGKVNSVAFSPDGRRIVTGSLDKTARVWDAESGQEVPVLRAHTNGVSSIAFSTDSKRFATGSLDHTVRVWDAATRKQILVLGRRGSGGWRAAGVWSVAFSPDGKRIVAGSNDRVAKIWDTTTGQELIVLKGHTAAVRGVAFSPDGKRIVTGASEWDNGRPGEAKVWDARTGQELLTFKQHTGGVTSVAFSPDGDRILTGSWDRTAKVWDARNGQQLLAFKGHTGSVTSVAFSPDGERIVTSSSDKTAKTWDAKTGQELLAFKGHIDSIISVAFSPDGERIVTGSNDRTAKLWDTGTGREVFTLKAHTNQVWSVAFSPDGRRIVTGIGGESATVKVWNAETAQNVRVLKGHTDKIAGVAFSPDGKRIFAWDTEKKVLAWAAVDGKPISPVDPPQQPPPGPARSPDGLRRAVPQGNIIAVTDKRPSLEDNVWPLPKPVSGKDITPDRPPTP